MTNMHSGAQMVLALLMVSLLASPVLAQGGGPTTSVSAGFDGYCRRSAWCPLRVVLSNEGPDVEGELQVVGVYTGISDPTTYARSVSLPSHSRKAYFLYLPPSGWSTRRTVRLVSEGEVLAEQGVSLRTVGGTDPLYVVVGGAGDSLNFLADVGPPGTTGRVAYLSPENLPPDPLGWEAMDLLVLSDVDTSALSIDQRRALEVWIAHGGHLVVAGGSGGGRTAAGIADLLPVTVGPVRSVESLRAMKERLGVALVPGPYALTETTVREGEVLLEQDGLPLIVRRTYGAGVVDFLAFGTGADLFARWEDGARLWSLLVETRAPSTPPLAFHQGYSAMEAVGVIPDLPVPSPLHLLAFILAYTLLVGPVNYLVLKRMDRRELAWATIPLLVVVFTACAYLTGLQVRGFTPIVHRLVAIRVPPGGDVGRATAAVGLFSPRRTTYDLWIGGTGVYQADWEYYGTSLQSASPDRLLQEAEGTRIVGVRVDVGGIRPFITETYVDVPPVEADLRLVPMGESGFRLEGTVRNGPSRLTDAVLIVGRQEQRLGDLEPGTEATVRLDLQGAVQTTPVGPSAFVAPAGPYGWGDLPDRILGEGEYWADRDLYRKYQFLSALFSNSPGLGSGIHLVGWAEEEAPEVEVEVVDRSSRRWTTAFYVYDLPVALPETGVSFRIPPDLVFCGPEETERQVMPFLEPHQTAVFRCTPWTEVRATRMDEVVILLRGDGEIEVAVWNWEEEAWAEIGEDWGEYTLASPDPFVSPAGAIRLQIRTGGAPVILERMEVTMKGER